MHKGSPFYVETQLGKLELTKGAYLTLQKRKSSTLRTLTKTKIILKDTPKPTAKRILRSKALRLLPSEHSMKQVQMVNREGVGVRFRVQREGMGRKVLGSNLPSISMVYDNDAESEWGEIEGCIGNLMLSLSLAAYDHRQANTL